MKYGPRSSHTLLLTVLAMLFALVWAEEAGAADLNLPISCSRFDTSYALGMSETINAATPARITTSGASPVTWSASTDAAAPCGDAGDSDDATWVCAGMTATLPTGSVASSAAVTVTGGGLASSPEQVLTVTATSNDPATPGSCTATITFRVTAEGGGWGDPHLTTVDGVKYDFQSAGEFTALREKGLVIQTRQSPVPSATVPITNAYTGITHCVSIYTAVAAKLGSTRVTLQPSPGEEPDPKSMQLRVNGKLTTLERKPFTLGTKDKFDGTITGHPDGVVEITDARGTQLVVTPRYWSSQKVWYLNLNVYGTSAHEGTLGRLPEGSWLPALPDGSSVGPKPESETERYQVLYEKFADAWRVKEDSLFDYEEGTDTATFTLEEWPRNRPNSCAIEGQTSVQATTEPLAQQACANVTDANQKADCVFDVMITGNTDFAKSYEIMQRFKPRASGWYTPVPPERIENPQGPIKPCPPPAPCPPPPAWCRFPVIALGALLLILLTFFITRWHYLSKKP